MPAPSRQPWSTFHVAVVGAIAAAMCAPGHTAASAQPPPAPPQKAPQPPAQPGLPPSPTGPLVTFAFPGGTIADFVKAIQKAAEPAAVNISVAADAAPIPVPPVEYRQVAVSSALDALPAATRGRAILDVRQVGDVAGGSGVYAISLSPSFMPPGQPFSAVVGDRPTVQAFSIRQLIDPPADGPGAAPIPVESVLAAVDAAIALGTTDLQGAPEPPQVKFHRDSGVLIVRGTQDQIISIKNLLDTMHQDLAARTRAAHEAAERAGLLRRAAAEREQALRQATVKLDLQRQELELAEAAHERARSLVETGQASQDELIRAKAELARRRAELQMAQLEVQRLAEADRAPEVRPGAPGPRPSAVTVTYDLRDLKPFAGNIVEIFRMIVGRAPGDENVRPVPSKGDAGATFAVRATPDQHHLLIQVLNLARRLKAGDPTLPGLNPEDLLKGAQKE
jgi:hypothetical protein